MSDTGILAVLVMNACVLIANIAMLIMIIKMSN